MQIQHILFPHSPFYTKLSINFALLKVSTICGMFDAANLDGVYVRVLAPEHPPLNTGPPLNILGIT